jgi:hypothetical protein
MSLKNGAKEMAPKKWHIKMASKSPPKDSTKEMS